MIMILSVRCSFPSARTRIVTCRLSLLSGGKNNEGILREYLKMNIPPKVQDGQFKLSSSHFVSEQLSYVPTIQRQKDVVNFFRERIELRRSSNGPKDKACNPLAALSASAGSGKSTFLAHLPQSSEYASYHKERTTDVDPELRVSSDMPIVSLLTFNSGMTEPYDAALGLRIIYGAIRAMGVDDKLEWQDFHNRHKELSSMTGLVASKLLRECWEAKDRLMYVGVDEMAKAKEPSKTLSEETVQERLMSELGAILDMDGRTDVLVSSLQIGYMVHLISESNRHLCYSVSAPVDTGETKEWQAAAKKLVCELEEKETLSVWGRRILRRADMFASGHPRSVEYLIREIKGHQLHLTKGKGEVSLFWQLAYLPVFTKFAVRPYNEKEWKLLFSGKRYNVARGDSDDEKLARSMLEGNRCRVCPALSEQHMLTAPLSMFFTWCANLSCKECDMLTPLSTATKTLFDSKSSQLWEPARALSVVFFTWCKDLSCKVRYMLTPLSAATKTLFDSNSFDISQLWERARALSVVSRSIRGLRFIADVYEADAFGRGLSISGPLQVRIAKTPDDIVWQANTVIVMPKDHPGSDMVTCCEDADGHEVYVYEETKCHPPRPKDKKRESVLLKLIANKLRLALKDHCMRLSGKGHGDKSKPLLLSKEEESEIFQSFYFVLSVYGDDIPDGAEEVLKQLRKDKINAAVSRCKDEEEKEMIEDEEREVVEGESVVSNPPNEIAHEDDFDRAIRFIEGDRKNWASRVLFMGTAALEEVTPPVLLPIAELVSPEEVETEKKQSTSRVEVAV